MNFILNLHRLISQMNFILIYIVWSSSTQMNFILIYIIWYIFTQMNFFSIYSLYMQL